MILKAPVEQLPFCSPLAEKQSEFFWINWLISLLPVLGAIGIMFV